MSEWFGTIPERWEQLKVNDVFVERREMVSDTDFKPLSVSKSGTIPQISTVAKSNAGDNRKLVRKGDFAINSRSDRRGSSGVSELDGSVSLINIVLTPRKDSNRRYWHYLLRSHSFIEEYYRNGRGIVADLWTTRYTEMKGIYVPLPPRTEQDQIVRFLDWKVSKINRLINAKKKQIELLQEQKRAVINEAVTRGGEGWETRYISQVSSEQQIKNTGNIEKNILSLSYGEIVRKKNMNSALIPVDYSTWQIVDKGNIVLRLTDLQNDHTSLRTGLVYERGIVTSAYTCLKAWDVPEFLYFALHSLDVRKVFYGLGGGVRQSIGFKDIRYNQIPYPPILEQQAIVIDLNQKILKIKNINEKLHSELFLLQEYRTRLISDVVTGKMDVRSITVPQYEVEEEVADDDTDEESIAEEASEE